MDTIKSMPYSDKQELLKIVIQKLKDKDESMRLYAAKALGELRYARAVDPLKEVLEEINQYIYVRIAAAEALGEIGDEDAVEPLINALIKDKNESMRSTAAEAIGKLIGTITSDSLMNEAVDSLIKVVKERTTGAADKNAVIALGKIKNKEVIKNKKVTETLIKVMWNDLKGLDVRKKGWGIEVRKAAIDALAEIGDPGVIKDPIEMVKEEKNDYLLKAANEAIEKLREKINEEGN